MNPQLTQSLLGLLLLGLIASIASLLVYFTLRPLEYYSQIACGVLSLFICITPLFWDRSRLFLNGYLVSLFSGLIGSIFHQKLQGQKSSFLSSFLLMFAVSLSANFAMINFIRYNLTVPQGPISYSFGFIFGIPSRYLALVFIIGQSITPPFLLWVWKSSRLRPGIDKHFDD